MEILRFFAGPLIGAVIGYFTNYIAVKMLFYPRKEIRVFGRRLPFTPGAIPKGQQRLAKAVGTVIENNLLTKEDVEEKLLSPAAENKVADAVMGRLSGNLREEICAISGWPAPDYEEKKAALCQGASRKIIQAVQTSGVTGTLLQELAASLRERASGTAWRMLVNSKTIGSAMGPAQAWLDETIDRRGAEYIAPILEQELTKLDSGTGLELLSGLDQEEAAVRAAVIRAYRTLIGEHAASALRDLHIAGLVEDKISAMSVEELERLVWSVMKKELRTIINLGALIGFVLGLLNTLIP